MQSGTQLCSAQPDAGKTGGGRRVNGLSPGSSYDFAVATCTDAELVASVGPKTQAMDVRQRRLAHLVCYPLLETRGRGTQGGVGRRPDAPKSKRQRSTEG